MQVIELLAIESLRLDRLGVGGRLPEAAISVLAGICAKWLVETRGHVPPAVIDQRSRCEFPEVGQCRFEGRRVEILHEEHGMEVRGHDDVCVDSQSLVVVTEIQAVRSARILHVASDTKTGSQSTTVIVSKWRAMSSEMRWRPMGGVAFAFVWGDLRSGRRRGQRPAPNAFGKTAGSETGAERFWEDGGVGVGC